MIPRSVLQLLDGVSIMAHATLLRCYALADEDGDVHGGLLRGCGAWGMTKEDITRALAELEAAELLVVRPGSDRRGRSMQRVVTLLEWDDAGRAA
jgi:hypothetical protein